MKKLGVVIKMSFNSLKNYQGKIYSGMEVGGELNWNYPNGKWSEVKVAPDRWRIKFESSKKRIVPAPLNSGAALRTMYNWFIIADQKVTKVDKDTYQTLLEGIKYKLGHKRPYWKTWSYNYKEQLSYKERVIKILEESLRKLKGGER